MDVFLTLFGANRLPLILVAIFAHMMLFSSTRLYHMFSFPLSLSADLIFIFNQRYNRSHATDRTRRKDSYSIAIFLVILGLVTGLGLSVLSHIIPYGQIADILILAVLLGIRPLMKMARLITKSLKTGIEEKARAVITLLTGRVTVGLNKQQMAAIGINEIAARLVQWVIAPIFWYALGGLPALFVFKLLDTACLMIDDRSSAAKDFGAASRIFANILTIPPALLSLPLLLSGGLVMKDASVKRGLSALAAPIRQGSSPLYLPGILVAAMLGVDTHGTLAPDQAGNEIKNKAGDKIENGSSDFPVTRGTPVDIPHLRTASRLAAYSILSLFIFIGVFALILAF